MKGDPAAPSTEGAQPQEAILSVRGATKTYEMGDVSVHPLRGTDIDLYRGEFVVLPGPSGSGKPTLLNLMGGLDSPSSGEIRYQGQALGATGEKQLTAYRRDHVGFVFQFNNLIPSLTVLENAEAVTEIAPDPLSTNEALELVGLRDRIDHLPCQLSGAPARRGHASEGSIHVQARTPQPHRV